MKLYVITFLLLLTLPATAQERQPRTDARERTPAELSIIVWNQTRRIETLERELREEQDKAQHRDLEWAALQVYVSIAFWISNVVGGALLATGAGWVIKRVVKGQANG